MSAFAPSTRASPNRPATAARVPWRIRAALAALGLVLALLIGELALRILGPHLPVLNSLTSIASFQTYHPTYGFFHRPGAAGWIRTPEFTSFVQISAQGLRDREFAIPKPAGTFRALVLGDSFVEGAQIPLEATVAKRLEQRLRATAGEQIEIVNAGNAGFGTAQELLFLERDGPTFQPDLVLLVFFVDNDLPDNGYGVSVERGLDTDRRPFFLLDERGDLWLRPFTAPEADPLGGAKATARRFSRLVNVVENLALWQEARDQENQQIGKNRPSYQIEPPPEWEEAWLVTEKLIARAGAVARAMGADFLLVVAPSNYQIDEQAWRWLVAGAQDRGRRYDRETPNRRLSKIAERTSTPVFDLLPGIRHAAANGARLYFADDGHWTAEGHAAGARLLTDYLISAGLVPTR